LGVRLPLSAGGGLDLAAAPMSPAPVTESANAAYDAVTTTIKLAFICTPWVVGEVMLPVLGAGPARWRVSAGCLGAGEIVRCAVAAVRGQRP